MPRFNLLSVGFQKAENERIRAGQSEALKSIAVELADKLGKVLAQHCETCKAINASTRLSAQGKRDDIQAETAKTLKAIEAMDGTDSYFQDAKKIDGEIINKMARVREQTKPKDKDAQFLDALHGREIREWLSQHRIDEKAKHDAHISQQIEKGAILSDQERQFIDPVESIYLEACRTYDDSKAAFIRAVESAPFPVQILPPESLLKGNELLIQAVAGNMLAAKQSSLCKIDMVGHVIRAAGEIARNPLHHTPIHEQYAPISDQERKVA